MNTEMDTAIKALIDREAIRDLRTLYALHLDSNHIAALDQVFAPDAVVEVTVGKMEGITAIQAGLSDAFQQFDRDHRPSKARRKLRSGLPHPHDLDLMPRGDGGCALFPRHKDC